jgi:hypothetical protein
MKGEVYRLPDNRLRLFGPNGSVVNFTTSDIRSMTYEDGSRVTSLPALPQQSQQNQQNRQTQQRPGGQQQQNQQNRPNTQQSQQRPGAQQSNRNSQQPSARQTQPNTRQPNTRPNSQTNQQNRATNNRATNQQQQRQSQQNQASNNDLLFEDEGLDILLSPTPPNSKSTNSQKQTTNATNSRQSSATQTAARSQTVEPAEPDQFYIRPKVALDAGYTMGLGSELSKASRMEFSLSFGMQVTRDLFVGIGAGVNTYSDKIYLVYDSATVSSAVDTLGNISLVIPIFLDARYDFRVGSGSIIPFAGIKAGTSLSLLNQKYFISETSTLRKETKLEKLGLYISPSVGAKFMLGRAMALSLSLAYTIQMREYIYNASVYDASGVTAAMIVKEGLGGLTIRAGLEF